MLLKILFNYLIGFVNITVEGFFVERFINNCINNKIVLWNIKRKNSTLITTNVSIRDFTNIRHMAKKTKCKLKINLKKGLPFIIHKYRKRRLLLILLIPVLLIILISSMYIWNIEITGSEDINKNELISQLKEEGVYSGNKKSKINVKKVIDNIRLKRSDISWMSIDMKGTNIIINVVKAEPKPDIINENEHCNIVATKNGMITKITADNGTALVKKGDIVEPGDILIGGYMEGKFTDKRYLHAKGKVEAKVWYTKKAKSYYTREITQKTENKKNRYSININNFKINLYKTLPKFENYDTINETNKMRIFSNFYLPLQINKTTYIELEKSKVTYGKEELKQILIKELEQEFEKDEVNKLNIVNKIINVYDNDDKELEIEMTYEAIEEIGTEEKIE